MKLVKIAGKTKKVFVLRETDASLVYIPIDAIQRVDYNRLLEVEERGGDMLNEMRKTKLENGLNALAMYDDIIQVMQYTKDKKDSIRVPKPDDGRIVHEKYEQDKHKLPDLEEQQEETRSESEEEKPKRRGPGRPRKSKEED